jgi:hypothetical protein
VLGAKHLRSLSGSSWEVAAVTTSRSYGSPMRPHVAALALVLATGGLAGCGKDADRPAASSSSAPPVSAAAEACRSQWRTLGDRVPTLAATGVAVRRAFASRWESVAAGADYYTRSATGSQCGPLLIAQTDAVAALEQITTRALRFDTEQHLATALAARTTPGRPKETRAVASAYVDLARQTPAATADLAPAFTELADADPGDPAAVAQGFSDLRLLARTSDAYAACARDLTTVRPPTAPTAPAAPGGG